MNNDEFIMFTIGRVAILYKGEYDSTVTYSMLDCVSYNGSLYFCIKEAINKAPSNKEYWITGALSAYDLAIKNGFNGTVEEWLASLKGDKGDTGEKGEKGNTGDTGETGNGIVSTEKTQTEGLIDTYTITYTDGNTENFQVKNGKDFNEEELNQKLENYEKKHTYYSMTIKEAVADNMEVEIPCSYIVGNDSLVIYHNGDRLICEKSETDLANYKEVGQAGEISNKIVFGWDLRVGDVLDFIVKGVVENEEN